jgi:hypothetical protein
MAEANAARQQQARGAASCTAIALVPGDHRVKPLRRQNALAQRTDVREPRAFRSQLGSGGSVTE